jgi:hypothetical protein
MLTGSVDAAAGGARKAKIYEDDLFHGKYVKNLILPDQSAIIL